MQKLKPLLVLILLIILNTNSFSQSIISGFIYDRNTGEVLINAHVYNETTKKGTLTNPYGFFSSSTNANDSLKLSFSFVGYGKITKSIYCKKDTSIIIMLESGKLLDDVVVKSIQTQNEDFTPSDKISFTGKQLEMLPGLLGEKDVIKSLQLMPGIQMGKEGSSGIFVRGGDYGQNLILLDGMPVYNINHLFGFFSVFTPEIINSVDVYKGGFPARYSGRLSSVIDVRLREGNLYKKKIDFTIGTISSKIIYESPIKVGKSSFIFAARRTYADLFYTPLSAVKQEDIYKTTKTWSGYNFYDINLKTNFIISGKDHLYFSVYTGRDKLFLSETESYNQRGLSKQYIESGKLENHSEFNNQWGNVTLSSRWNHLFSNKYFSNTTISYSTYKYKTLFGNHYIQESLRDTLNETVAYNNFSGVKDLGLASDFDFSIFPKLKVLWGIRANWRNFVPSKLDLIYEEKINPSDNFSRNVHSSEESLFEFNSYIENHITLFKNMFVNAGAAFMIVNQEGNTFLSFQPRLLAKYKFNNKLSGFGSWTKMSQPIHLLVDNGSTFPVDMWVPAVKNLKPAQSNQLEFGINYNINAVYEIKTEVYYKKMTNIINYKNGESFFSLNETWYDKITQGKGDSKGIEFLLEKKSGKLKGWIGYSLSETNQQFDDLNKGKPFPFKYDNTHQLKLVSMYEFNEKIDVFGSWVYTTGMPITLSLTGYEGESIFSRSPLYGMLNDFGFFDQKIYSPQNVTYYEGLNDSRLPDYHRLDFGINFKKQKRRGERTWSFSVYNVYARNNPMMIFAQTNDNGKVVYNNFTVFTFVPSISYRFNFNAFD